MLQGLKGANVAVGSRLEKRVAGALLQPGKRNMVGSVGGGLRNPKESVRVSLPSGCKRNLQTPEAPGSMLPCTPYDAVRFEVQVHRYGNRLVL